MENDNLQGMDRDELQAERARWIEIRESKRAAIIEHLPLGEPGKTKFSAAEGLLLRRREFDVAEARVALIDERLGKT